MGHDPPPPPPPHGAAAPLLLEGLCVSHGLAQSVYKKSHTTSSSSPCPDSPQEVGDAIIPIL